MRRRKRSLNGLGGSTAEACNRRGCAGSWSCKRCGHVLRIPVAIISTTTAIEPATTSQSNRMGIGILLEERSMPMQTDSPAETRHAIDEN